MKSSCSTPRQGRTFVLLCVSAMIGLGARGPDPARLHVSRGTPGVTGDIGSVLSENGIVSVPVQRYRGIPFLKPPAADTMRFETPAGRVFITLLPDSLGGQQIREYTNVRVPAHSWRKGRAFFWQTSGRDVGVNHISFMVGTELGADTLTLAVRVEP